MRYQKVWPTVALALMIGTTAACSSNSAGTGGLKTQTGAGKQEAPPEPVTINMLTDWKITDDDLNQIFYKPLAAKYPHLKLNIITASNTVNIKSLIAAGDVPDMLLTGTEGFQQMLDLGVALDLNELIRLQGFDMNRLDPIIVQTIKGFGKKGEIYALPYGMNYNALYYNKSLFDRFAVKYPTDGMTWGDTIELGKRVSRNDGGVLYRGLAASHLVKIASPLSLNRFDPATGKVSINTDQWKRAYEVFQSIVSIPNNTNDKKNGDELNAFLYDKTIAMYPYIGLFHRMADAVKGGLDWDLVTYPTFPDKPGVYGEADAYYLFVTPNSKHQKEAFQVISTALSDDAQLASSKKGTIVTPLVKKEVRDSFGQESDVLKGKNVQAIFKNRPVPYHSNPKKYDAIADSELNAGSLQLYGNAKDINTIIRESEEKIAKKVAEQEGK
ncbi:ABC transporter substrate-binding protein [Paenibacillus ginsengarvi]|uniref:Extracellular solute-binding protein n=1 Tax=Paenibacillus ginsengarvi TaxID=400777 RepID=A0A3B0CKN9_9BACL|nr:extracellular solute-binding protein [Paenibacillus ginsengarvi]RKN86265.1 extracellular solute-binding protein [Paenibacillus ginsengarvi]